MTPERGPVADVFMGASHLERRIAGGDNLNELLLYSYNSLLTPPLVV